jgi:hypothetical protein
MSLTRWGINLLAKRNGINTINSLKLNAIKPAWAVGHANWEQSMNVLETVFAFFIRDS